MVIPVGAAGGAVSNTQSQRTTFEIGATFGREEDLAKVGVSTERIDGLVLEKEERFLSGRPAPLRRFRLESERAAVLNSPEILKRDRLHPRHPRNRRRAPEGA